MKLYNMRRQWREQFLDHTERMRAMHRQALVWLAVFDNGLMLTLK